MKLPTECARCAASCIQTPLTMSFFNEDWICVVCVVSERTHPEYQRAKLAEIEAVHAGNLNYEGIGCPPELYVRKSQTA